MKKRLLLGTTNQAKTTIVREVVHNEVMANETINP